MDRQLNVGVIGLGGISHAHIKPYQANPRSNLMAICDIDEAWLMRQSKELNVNNAYVDYRDLLANPEVEAVSVCVPNYLHAEVVIAALEAGKHVLCEKPMAVNADEARAMKDAAEKAGKKLMISQNQRFGQDAQLLKRAVESGLFGEIYFIRTGWRRPLGMMPGPIWKRADGSIYSRNWFNEKDKGGGVLRDLGSHLIDLALYLTDFPECIEASCSCYRKFYPDERAGKDYPCDSEDLAAGHLKFDNGMSIEFEVSFGSFIEEEVVFTEIYGAKAGASRRNGEIKFFKAIDGGFTTETVRSIDIETKGPVDRFIDCVLDDTEVPVTPTQGVTVIDVLDRVYKSAGSII